MFKNKKYNKLKNIRKRAFEKKIEQKQGAAHNRLHVINW